MIQNTEHNPEQHWAKCLKYIKDNIDEQAFNTWFTPVKFQRFDGKELRIIVPSNFFYEYLEEHYLSLLQSAIGRYFGSDVRLRYIVKTDSTNNITTDISSQPHSTAVESVSCEGANKTPDIFSATRHNHVADSLDSRLNPNYTFENFIEGDSNKFPRMIGLTIADKFQDSFNPFFIYGASGVGKTHLANAIGTRMKELHPDKRVLYVSAHLLRIQYTDSVHANKFNDFMNFYQSIDTLIIDDIQEFAGKKGTQEAFFNIFNHLQHNHRQLIITCDRPPVQLEGMQERLLTRFNWGIIGELERPNAKLRKDILEYHIQSNGLPFPKNVINYIANNVTGSIRELEGVINSIMAYSVIYNSDIDMDLATKTIARTVKINNDPISTDRILEKVCKFYHITNKEVFSASRKHGIVQARQVSMYLTQKYTNLSSSQIGLLIGKRDHSTVLHACNLIEKRISVEKSFRAEVESIEREILKRP